MEEMPNEPEMNSPAIIGASYKAEKPEANENEMAEAMEESTLPAGELPMVVWLRGDEPFVADFNIDAEGAMQALGIKRSRLTQISGRELRVGRIRIDRYIRPMYRQVDIEAYRQWTRATATHLRSSSVISEAAHKLEDHAFQLSENLVTSITEFTDRIETSLVSLREEAQNQQQAFVQTTQNAIDGLSLDFTEKLNKQKDEARLRFDEISHYAESQGRRLNVLDQIQGDHSLISTKIDHLNETITNLDGATKAELSNMRSAQDAQASFNRDIGKALSLILQFQRDYRQKQDELAQGMKNLWQEVSHLREVAPRRRQMRPIKRKLAHTIGPASETE